MIVALHENVCCQEMEPMVWRIVEGGRDAVYI